MAYDLPVKVAIINNGYHGMVRQWQQMFYQGHYSASRLEGGPDYVKLAEAYGAVGLRATEPTRSRRFSRRRSPSESSS
jgi:acetolactate synthase-1/2/3 large subunit